MHGGRRHARNALRSACSLPLAARSLCVHATEGRTGTLSLLPSLSLARMGEGGAQAVHLLLQRPWRARRSVLPAAALAMRRVRVRVCVCVCVGTTRRE